MVTNHYLALITEVIQRKPYQGHIAPTLTTKVSSPVMKVDLPPSLVDASELFARWLWLQLPDASKKDMQA